MTTSTSSNVSVVPMSAVPMFASGTIVAVSAASVTFKPEGTSYQLQLTPVGSAGPVNKPIKAVIRVKARKVYTVPNGGNFISPVLGPPRTIQGRVRSISENSIIVQAGVPVHVELPQADSAIDLASGPIAVGGIVNVVAMPDAQIEVKASGTTGASSQ